MESSSYIDDADVFLPDIAYNSYSLVWQEYKKMGQSFNEHMDRDTISAIQFGYVHTLYFAIN
jgi:hypothetical protein